LLEIVRRVPLSERPLRVFAPRFAANVPALARRFAAATRAVWVVDPLEVSPTHILRPREQGWELLDRDGKSIVLANDEAAIGAITRLRASASLFVQLPPMEPVIAASDPQDADYLLVGRFHRNRIEYSWIRPLMRNSDRHASGLPPRTAWTSDPKRLRRDVATLRRIHSWFSLTTPPDTPTPYRLAIRDERTGTLVRNPVVVGNAVYSLVLRSSEQRPERPRWYYVFVVDGHGNSRLVFPRTGSLENRFPPANQTPAEISLGNPSAFRITRPYGVDTYVLLSAEEPLPNPSILGWDGVRARRALAETRWSIERITFESVAPPRRRASAGRAAPRRR
jgi:hypothetical protein